MHSFTTVEIEEQEGDEVEYLEFKYIQTLMKKIGVRNKDMEFLKLDSTLAKVYYNYMEIKGRLVEAEGKLRGIDSPKEDEESVESLKEMIIEQCEQKNDLITKVNTVLESNQLLLT